MLRSLTFSLALAAALLSPSPARASGIGEPLWTLCNGPAMEYCMSLLSSNITYGGEIGGYPWAGRWAATVHLFGSGYETEGPTGAALTYKSPVCPIEWTRAFAVDGPGVYSFTETDGGVPCEYYGLLATESFTVPATDYADLLSVRFSIIGGVSCDPRSDNCYVVPEPGSLLMVATGIVGLVGAGWRRRAA